MISPLLAKLYGIILEKKMNGWLEMKIKRAKGQAGFRKNHSTTDHLLTLSIIAEECCNNKSDLFCCFVDFRKSFDTMPRNNLSLQQILELASHLASLFSVIFFYIEWSN